MSVYNEKFRKARKDYSPYLFHFIKGACEAPRDTMRNILDEMKLKSSRGYICFSASPLTSIGRFFETKVNRTGKPMYVPYGIGFSRDILVRNFGAKNVIYCDNEERRIIPEQLEWRTMCLNVDSYDYEYLREWRIKGTEFDFSTFPSEHLIVIAPDIDSLNDLTISHAVEFRPIVDYINGDIDPDWDEVFNRKWKGIAADKAEDLIDDFAVSGSTVSQVIGEDMFDQLLATSPYCLGNKRR